jgi:hypothetical protein
MPQRHAAQGLRDLLNGHFKVQRQRGVPVGHVPGGGTDGDPSLFLKAPSGVQPVAGAHVGGGYNARKPSQRHSSGRRSCGVRAEITSVR